MDSVFLGTPWLLQEEMAARARTWQPVAQVQPRFSFLGQAITQQSEVDQWLPHANKYHSGPCANKTLLTRKQV